ncbi:hypothetical protein F5Y19DRAFT_177815 [Xylariaceae sp. FL1651]|nr:hypothetical protein F5Y19DRAFT_177815 [Xylariaceae sp. FL1651]
MASSKAVANSPGSTQFRRSCDTCQHSKVKCSRDKPVCKRCAQKRFDCVYSAARRTGRPKSRVPTGGASEQGSRFGEMDINDEEEDEDDGSPDTAVNTLSPAPASANHGHSTPATSPCQSGLNGASNNLGHVSATRSEDALFRSVVDTWISNRELTASAAQSFRRTSGGSDTDCYTAVLARTTKLEQALSQAPSPPTIDLVLEAEQDFSNLRHRLFACTGHHRLLPVETTSPLSMAAPPTISSTDPCLATNRPVLLGLAILAERVTGLLEEMFRLAAQVSQSMDQANDFVWSETLGTTDPSSRRAHRSLRNVMDKPCVSVGMVSYRELRLDDFVVEGQAKTDTMGRILKLRVKRMLRALEVLDSAKQTRQRGEQRKRGQPSGGPLDWGSSTTVCDTMAGTLLDDLMRRMESLQGAMILL